MIHKLTQNIKEGKNFIKFGLINVFGQFFGLVLSLILAKFLNPAGFGAYSLSFMIIALFSALLINSSQTPFIIHANQENKKTGKINNSFSSQLVFFGISVILFVLIVLLFSSQLSLFAGIEKFSLVFLVLAFLGMSMVALLSNLFMALDRKNESAIVTLVNSFLIVLFVVIFYYLKILSLQNLFLIYFISGILVLFIFLGRVGFKSIFPFELDHKNFKEQWDFTKWQIFGFVALYLINWGDNLVLRYYVSIEQIGIYNLAYKLFTGLMGITFIINLYFLPFLSKNIGNRKLIADFLNRKRKLLLSLGTLLIGILAFISPVIINFLYGPNYSGSILVFLILLIALVLGLYFSFYGVLFNSMKKFKFLQTTNIIQVIINLGFDVILIPFIGIIGAAIATVLGYFTRALLLEVYYQRKIKKLFFI